MNSKIHSARLTFTKLALHDWELFRSIYSNPALMEHIGATMSEETIRGKFEEELSPWSLESNHWLTWIIRETTTANDVGLISIYTRDRDKLTAEVGFILLNTYKGKGYATEAIKHNEFRRGYFWIQKIYSGLFRRARSVTPRFGEVWHASR